MEGVEALLKGMVDPCSGPRFGDSALSLEGVMEGVEGKEELPKHAKH